MTTEVQTQDEHRAWKREDVFTAAKDEVYVIFRYGLENKQLFRNAWVLEQKIIENYGGKFLGFSDKITVLENSTWPEEHCINLLIFRNGDQATHWMNSDRIFKQQHMEYEAFMVPLQYIPTLDYKTFTLMEVKVPLSDEMVARFEKEYVCPASALMDQFHVAHGVVASNGITHFRQVNWDFHGKTLVVHQYKSPEQFDYFYNSDAYQELIKIRNNMYQTNLVMFTLIDDPPLMKKK